MIRAFWHACQIMHAEHCLCLLLCLWMLCLCCRLWLWYVLKVEHWNIMDALKKSFLFFFNILYTRYGSCSAKIISTFSNQAILSFLSVWCYQGRSHNSWLTLVFYLRPARSELSSVCHCFTTSETRMTSKRLRCFVVRCNNEHSSRHLLLTSDPLKMQWITFVFKRECILRST